MATNGKLPQLPAFPGGPANVSPKIKEAIERERDIAQKRRATVMRNLPDYTEGSDLLRILVDDAKLSGARVKDADTQFHRRTFIRALFPLWDGFAAVLRSRVLSAYVDGGITLTKKELKVLRQGEQLENEDGSQRWRPDHPPLKENLKVSIRCYAKSRVVDNPFKSDFRALDALQQLASVRHRVTHPEKPGGLDISDEELSACFAALQFFAALYQFSVQAELAHIDTCRRKIKESTQQTIDQIRHRLAENSKEGQTDADID